jgi:hypothetical protein
MPYCAKTFALVKQTEKYKNQMCELNRKSYNKLKTVRHPEYIDKLVSKQARYFIETKKGDEIQRGLCRVLEKQGEARYQSLLNKLNAFGINIPPTIPAGSVGLCDITADTQRVDV